MSVNNMTVGRDYSFGYYDANTGLVVDLGDVQNVKVSAVKHDIASRPYNSPPRYGYIPDGYTFSFDITRTNQRLEEFALEQTKRFNDGNSVEAGFLNETVKNPDGSVSRYQYQGFVFYLTDLGTIQRETTVKMSAVGMASSKVKIA